MAFALEAVRASLNSIERMLEKSYCLQTSVSVCGRPAISTVFRAHFHVQAPTKQNHNRGGNHPSEIPTAEQSLSKALSQSEQTLSNDSSQSRVVPIQARQFRSLQAIYLRPLKREPKYGIPACDLQLRSYSVRNVEFFADFALRAAYYLNLPASGPVPLPRIVERWTVPRSNFIFKKSQENFERITLRRLIQIQDGHAETVELWLAFLRKYQYYGIGMKANIWQFEPLGVGKNMDVNLRNIKQAMEPKWAHFGRGKTFESSQAAYEMMQNDNFAQEGRETTQGKNPSSQ